MTARGNGRRIKDERGTYVFNSRDQMTRWVLQENSLTFTYDFTYDGSGAIKSATGPGVSRFYYYEGDRLKCERTAAAPDALQPCTGAETSYEYNLFDNVTKVRSTDERKRKQYGYDGFERLTSTGPLDGPDKTRYDYDGLDRRDARYDVADNNKRYDYSYIGATEALSREDAKRGAEAEVRSYDYDSQLQRVGQSRKKAGGAFDYRGYAVAVNGDVQGLEAADGTFETDSYTLNPYGESRRDPSTEAAQSNPFRFQGHYYDDDLQAYDMQARMYRPELGRFLSPDRYESSAADLGLELNPRTNNRFAFLAGNPVDQIEIDGHEPPNGSYVNAPTDYYGEASMDPDARRAQNTADDREESSASSGVSSPDSRDRNYRDTDPATAAVDQAWRKAVTERVARRVSERSRPRQGNTGDLLCGSTSGWLGFRLCGDPESRNYIEANDARPPAYGYSPKGGAGLRGAKAGGGAIAAAKTLYQYYQRTDDTAKALAKHVKNARVRFAKEGYTPRQAAAIARQTNPAIRQKLINLYEGERLDAFVRESTNFDKRTAYLKKTPRGGKGPDFIDEQTGRWYDVTTSKGWAGHVRKYGDEFGMDAVPILHR